MAATIDAGSLPDVEKAKAVMARHGPFPARPQQQQDIPRVMEIAK
jgi:hypothetical protein